MRRLVARLMFRVLLVLPVVLASALMAQDGGQLYSVYCIACHGPDGKGAPGGTFPPLAGSPWLQGPPDRAIKSVIHGLRGPVEVLGKSYNVEMPPQGAVFDDAQLAAVISFVRSSWGNAESAVTPAQVQAIRAANIRRFDPWTAEELLKLHPLPPAAPALANLVARVYHGEWQDLPDFAALEPGLTKPIPSGMIDIADAGANDLVGVVWDGEFTAPADGSYAFRIDADDSARVAVAGRVVAEVRGIGGIGANRAKEAAIDLKAGRHPIRVEWMECRGGEGISLGWKGPGHDQWRPLSPGGGRASRPWPNMPISPTTDQAVIYRNFIEGTTPRGIGVGLPGGINLAWSADHFAPELVWTGLFMDGGRHWSDRGAGNEPPAGGNVVKPTNAPAYAWAGECTAGWPEKSAAAPRFRGYQLDPHGNPVFAVQVGETTILDAFRPGPAGGAASLLRELTCKNPGSRQPALLLARGIPVRQAGPRAWSLGNDLVLRCPDDPGPAPEVVGDCLVLRLSGERVGLVYTWTKQP